jgi:glucan-binding YG repeat protein
VKTGSDWTFTDSLGWSPKNQWQKIDGKWYFFDKEGYMEANAYRQGYYLTKDGAWDGKAKVIGWKQDSKGWWYSLGGRDFLKNGWKKIDGNWYYFKATGYIAINEFVQGWWLNKTGAWKDPVRYSWHKSGSKWWYGTKDGWYAKSKSYTIDGKKYTFDKKGYTK